MIGHSPVGAFSGHIAVARPYRTLENLREAPRLMVVPALGAVGCAKQEPFEKAVQKLYVFVSVLVMMAAVDFRFVYNAYSFEVWMSVWMRSLMVLSHRLNIPRSRLKDQNVRYCLGLKEHRLRNYLMSPPRRNRNLAKLIDLNFRSEIES